MRLFEQDVRLTAGQSQQHDGHSQRRSGRVYTLPTRQDRLSEGAIVFL